MIRRALAALLRRLATFTDTVEAPDPARAHALTLAAAVYRYRAAMLDPQAKCIVCGAIVSVAVGDRHTCPPHALDAWAARARAGGYEA